MFCLFTVVIFVFSSYYKFMVYPLSLKKKPNIYFLHELVKFTVEVEANKNVKFCYVDLGKRWGNVPFSSISLQFTCFIDSSRNQSISFIHEFSSLSTS